MERAHGYHVVRRNAGGYRAPKAGREAWRREDTRKRTKLALMDPELVLELSEVGKPVIPHAYAEIETVAEPVGTWLALPERGGYGNQWQWPFNFNYAVALKGYRVGVLRAMRNLEYAPNWRSAAASMMERVIETLDQLHHTVEDIEEEERFRNSK